MASKLALTRAAKANRRKAVVAQKRKLELVKDTLAARVLRAAQAPIRHCLISESFDSGMGTVILTRGVTPFELTVGGFLVDTWSLGVKDAYFRSVDAESFEDMVEDMKDAAPVKSVDPGYARKLVRDAAAWAASIGVAPHRDFAAVERLFGDVNADASDATFQFGRGGRPAHISGPDNSLAQIRTAIEAVGRDRLIGMFQVAESDEEQPAAAEP
jgi:hypothetical protein